MLARFLFFETAENLRRLGFVAIYCYEVMRKLDKLRGNKLGNQSNFVQSAPSEITG